MTRRDVVAGAAALGATTLARNPAVAQGAARRIDLHHHFFPPAFLEAQRNALTRQNRPPALGEAVAGWTQARARWPCWRRRGP